MKKDLSNTFIKYQPEEDLTEGDMQEILEQAKSREENLDYLNQDNEVSLDRLSDPEYLFYKSPQELMKYMQDQYKRRYPHRNSSKQPKEALDQVDW